MINYGCRRDLHSASCRVRRLQARLRDHFWLNIGNCCEGSTCHPRFAAGSETSLADVSPKLLAGGSANAEVFYDCG